MQFRLINICQIKGEIEGVVFVAAKSFESEMWNLWKGLTLT